MKFVTAIALFCASVSLASAQSPITYTDAAGGEVILPLGDLSFADAVVARTIGSGRIAASAETPDVTLGAPDYSGDVDDGSFLSLGCDGSVDLLFADNALIDVPGPDLYVFEVGPRVEGMFLAISEDGQEWTEVGAITGGRAEVDIAGRSTPGASYRYVRLTDDGEGCGTNFAGADVDAVAAIGTALRFTLDAAVLFDVDSSALRPEALAEINAVASQIAAANVASINVIGHTDSTGSDAYNMTLSLQRATSVRAQLLQTTALANLSIATTGRGELEPIASNETDAGRQANRRVEIIAVPN
ncbi:OmpA family protein [Hasllibacter sp. MH4015]|uniref:OmpA family protein n=1 Tax=Hasllibacter sp. MH4015 TaxID=2854029 RepID=UPI001CD5D997|nr:OmpA family protein [Hasllibacter sp. MH4015]